jgi:uncharacterized damage-inducible protein DinB
LGRALEYSAMLGKDDLERLLAYDTWANHRLMRAAATLSVDDFKRDTLRASHGGVRGTLVHILSSEWIWLERFKGLSPTRHLDEGEFPDVVALRDRWTLIEGHGEDWFRGQTDRTLAASVAYRSLQGAPFEAPLWQLMQHVMNHSTYHRGQVILLLRAVGARVVSTDLVAWDRARAAGAAGD